MEYYWGDITPVLFSKYVQAHNLKQREQFELLDQSNYLLGKYIMLAVADALGGKRNYPRQPFTTKTSGLKNTLTQAQVEQLLAKRNSEREQNEQASKHSNQR